jgi:hypothetical protein
VGDWTKNSLDLRAFHQDAGLDRALTRRSVRLEPLDDAPAVTRLVGTLDGGVVAHEPADQAPSCSHQSVKGAGADSNS